MFDLMFRDAKILDGSGNPWYVSDVGIKDGMITKLSAHIGEQGTREIDVSGLVLAPGFVDMHSHSDLMLLKNPYAPEKIRQGITTEVLGQDGVAPAPFPSSNRVFWIDMIKGLDGELGREYPFESMEEYFEQLDGNTLTNTLALIPHGAIRLEVLGLANREATKDEIGQMQKLVKKAMDEGAVGLSTGLIYPPCIFGTTTELVELCKVVSDYGGIYVTHMRNEGSKILDALQEAIEIGRRANIAVHISHLGAQSKHVWGSAGKIVEVINEARDDGVDVTCDQYPYLAGSTGMSILLPPWVFEKYGNQLETALSDKVIREEIKRYIKEHSIDEWESHFDRVSLDDIHIASVTSDENRDLQGKSLVEAAQARGMDPYEVLFDILRKDHLETGMVVFLMKDEDVETIMKSNFQMVCTDGVPGEFPHPRLYGAFPRVLGRYVREKEVLALETAVRKMTSLPAQRLRLKSRGLIKEGFHADITVFDSEKVLDMSTYENPCQFPVGIEYVVVNGALVVEKGQTQEITPGHVLKPLLQS